MPAPGGTSLTSLISTMIPILQPGTYVFATVPPADTKFQERLLKSAHPFEMLFRESEGWTLIAERATVEALGGLEAEFPCKKVTLGVHSSLDAVGFMAAVTTRLASAGMGINPVSGFYHDHLFVREGKEDLVVEMLRAMASECRADMSKGSENPGVEFL